uniref:Uncharacterized protein n=1 Tax=Arundo donax TaxID=35708 RepID=A0A0A9SIY7_ARUDO
MRVIGYLAVLFMLFLYWLAINGY